MRQACRRLRQRLGRLGRLETWEGEGPAAAEEDQLCRPQPLEQSEVGEDRMAAEEEAEVVDTIPV